MTHDEAPDFAGGIVNAIETDVVLRVTVLQGTLDLFVRALLAPVEDLGAKTKQNGDAVARAPGYLSRRNSGLKPQGDASVP
jgi:hypothetical protein